jgi:hypothetical protein
MLRTPVAAPESLQSRTSDPRASILGQRGHLRPDKTRRNHWLPRGPATRHSRARNHPIIIAWHSDSTMRTHINVMNTRTPDMLTWRGWGSQQEIESMKEPDSQHQNGSPFRRALHPPGNVVLDHAGLYSTMGWDTPISGHGFHACQLQPIGHSRG